MASIDQYLFHAFDVAESQTPHGIDVPFRPAPELIRLPMLLRVKDPTWSPDKVPHLSIVSRLGNIIACTGSRDSLRALQSDPEVLSVEASRPASAPETAVSIPFVKADRVHQGVFNERGDKALIAIIDEDIDVLHKAFQDANGKTRILAVWDQTDTTGPGPFLGPNIASFGREYTLSDINQYIANPRLMPQGLDAKRVLDGHGTHVASIAAGRVVSGSQFAGGVAPEAQIIVVIPKLQVNPQDQRSLGYSTSHVAALSYIADMAEKYELPVVVNLSQGMNAGAHDGTSLLETAFDSFTEGGRLPGRAVVKSSGNERNKQRHAALRMAKQMFDTLEWEISPEDEGPDVVEVWFKACDELTFHLLDPWGNASPDVSMSHPQERGYFPSGNGFHLSYEQYHHDNGDSRLLVMIDNGRAHWIKDGRWTLEMVSDEVKSTGEMHAWIECDADRPMYFVNHVSEEITVTIPGTAHTVICVGSIAPLAPFRVAPYSAFGPTRDGREKPELTAPGEAILAAQGQSLVGTASKRGTSQAAAHVSGAIALLFSYWEKHRATIPNLEQLNAAQIRAAISQMTQNYNGNWYGGMGFGGLDVEALLNTFC
jgi:subtilisin family serine protease